MRQRVTHKLTLAAVVGFVMGCASLPGGLWKPDTAQAAPGVPSWCAGANAEAMNSGSSTSNALDSEQSDIKRIFSVVATTCVPDAEAARRQSELTTARQEWSARMDLTEDDWSDLVAWASLDASARWAGDLQVPSTDKKKRPWGSLDPVEQWIWMQGPGPKQRPNPPSPLYQDHHYLADALGAQLTELGRLGYVDTCIDAKESVAWAMCQGDIDRIDYKKVAAEVRAAKYPPAEKARLRFHIAAAKKRLGEHADKVKKLIAGDPGYAKMFQVAAAAGKDWNERYFTNPGLVNLVAEMEEANTKGSRSAFAGCDEKTWAAWKAAVAAHPARTYEGHFVTDSGDFDARPIVTFPDSYLASVALILCTAGQADQTKPNMLIWSLGKYTEEWPGFRGPRTAAQTALLGAGITFDDRNKKLAFPSVLRPFAVSVSIPRMYRGVIAKLTPSGETVTVTFKTDRITELRCDDYKTTNKIIQFRPDGSPVYETICTKNKTVTFNSGDPPQTVDARYLQGAKPGMFVSVVGDVALAVWAMPTSTTPLLVYGVPVK